MIPMMDIIIGIKVILFWIALSSTASYFEKVLIAIVIYKVNDTKSGVVFFIATFCWNALYVLHLNHL